MIFGFDFQRDEVSFSFLLSHPTALSCIIAIIPVTVLVMVSAGRTTQAMTGRKKKEADHAE